MEENNLNQNTNGQTQQPDYNYHQNDNLEPVMTVGQWLITTLVMSIPCVNIVMLFVWGFGNGNRNRANYCKAALIMWIIGMILLAVMSGVFGVGSTLQTNVGA